MCYIIIPRSRPPDLGVAAPHARWRRAADAAVADADAADAIAVAVVVGDDKKLRRGAPLQDVHVEQLGL